MNGVRLFVGWAAVLGTLPYLALFILVPVWVGTGFLVPIAALLPAMDFSGTQPFLESWVQPLVYGGFAWQGVMLAAASGIQLQNPVFGTRGGPRSSTWARVRFAGAAQRVRCPTTVYSSVRLPPAYAWWYVISVFSKPSTPTYRRTVSGLRCHHVSP